jgi:hypothetical protein
MEMVDGHESGVMTYSLVANHDTVLDGRELLTEHLLEANIVPAPAAMARKLCYQRVGYFPPDLPYSGDWYLWAMFALYFQVGYFGEPMVNRRCHDRNMSRIYQQQAVRELFANNLAVPLRIQARAAEEGLDAVVQSCRRGLVTEYLRQVTPPKQGDVVQARLKDGEFEDSLCRHVSDQNERAYVRARVYAGLADHWYEEGKREEALGYYSRALRDDRGMATIWAKYLLLRMGIAGILLREALSTAKRHAKRIHSSQAYSNF